ncbi:hypothetical protein [Aquimarina sp. AU474]|uniref:hypothetical protein n=1 Tax=Aquimarina sp. AU474 TaxID=2108529 RepID=UPI00135C5216|nr:hypothetical protein [Aquimarina sp. AU474]
METTNLRIVYNHKRKYEVIDTSKKNSFLQSITSLQQWYIKFYNELKIWGRGAGSAIRN